MNKVRQIIKEQFTNKQLIFRLASFELKSSNRMNYLGIVWSFLNPLIQLLIFWVVFGLGIRSGKPVGETPYFVWLVTGLVPWFFISTAILEGSNSVYSKISLVSKMKFPVSVLPSIAIVKNAFNFLIMMAVVALILVIYKVFSGAYLFLLIYYLFALLVFLFAVTLLLSTLSTIIRDIQLLLQSVMRMIFFITPICWNDAILPDKFETTLHLNPMFYLIDGFRQALIGYGCFTDYIGYTIYFWLFTFFILFLGAFLHMKFKDKFVDYL